MSTDKAWTMTLPGNYWDLRTEPEVVDGLMLPVTACAQCGKRFPPYMAPVSKDAHDEYCWGHDAEKDELEAIVRAVAAAEPTVVTGDYFYAVTCGACAAHASHGEVDHEPTCPWLLASEWTAQHRSEGDTQ